MLVLFLAAQLFWAEHTWALVTWDWTDKEHKERVHHAALN